MSDIIIKAENVSKLYNLGEIGTGTLSRDLNRWWAKLRGKEDPYAKIGHHNDRTAKAEKGEMVWALKDISFDIKQGEVLGVIGKNGAGKSTLLKILSQVTTPTTGVIKAKGRIASLLEVGTGFHPELTGRENIFLNGAILGMTKTEIRSKFDEIVEFAGVAKYIDTPVKRYSSGMYVRLAFAVAAHLEPEILIVDEVLAVGDIEFQEKCLGKMKDVSVKDGRTVIFVSHNMAAITDICKNGLLLDKGMISDFGTAQKVVNNYMLTNHSQSSAKYIANIKRDIYIEEIALTDKETNEKSLYSFSDQIIVNIKISDLLKTKPFKVGVAVLDSNGIKIFTTHSTFRLTEKDNYKVKVTIPSNTLLSGNYSLDAGLFIPMGEIFDYVNDQCNFKIVDTESDLAIFNDANQGKVNICCKWDIL